jgi:hypothetical protein
MLNFFRPSEAAGERPKEAATLSKTSSGTRERRILPRPLPCPEVVEGNADSDEPLWQEFVALQENQRHPAWTATEAVPLEGATPNPASKVVDAFDSVHRRSK